MWPFNKNPQLDLEANYNKVEILCASIRTKLNNEILRSEKIITSEVLIKDLPQIFWKYEFGIIKKEYDSILNSIDSNSYLLIPINSYLSDVDYVLNQIIILLKEFHKTTDFNRRLIIENLIKSKITTIYLIKLKKLEEEFQNLKEEEKVKLTQKLELIEQEKLVSKKAA